MFEPEAMHRGRRNSGRLALGLFVATAVACNPPPPHKPLPTSPATFSLQGSVAGAIFTTTPDGTVVNENVRYTSKLEVYLDGGPGPNAPQRAAGLPDGDYVFQVTDPSGAVLLSEDPAKCRKVRVQDGVIVGLLNVGATYVASKNGDPLPCHVQDEPDGVAGAAGRHDINDDTDHGPQAKVVQLMPFFDTPNNGGVYKAWIISEAQYLANGGDPEARPSAQKKKGKQVGYDPDPGFGPARNQVKTDNFKVKRQGPPCDQALLDVIKFHDRNLSGVRDADEEQISGWLVQIGDPLGVVNNHYTPVQIETVTAGDWTIVEDTPAGTLQTVAIRDGVVVSSHPAADPAVPLAVAGRCGETHQVIYGNAGLGRIEACKVYDRDGDGEADEQEPRVAGWPMQLVGTDISGTPEPAVVQLTGRSGCTTFAGLRPGSYAISELLPSSGSWVPTGETSKTVQIESLLIAGQLTGTAATVSFTNVCRGTADFGTKGYWHNKNGLAEIEPADIAHVNGLAPYSAPSSYFDGGDEPFDGLFLDGTEVAAANGSMGETLAPQGTALAEISIFLVESNGGGDPREQLAQQLLAFIFNAIHRLGGVDAALQLPDGTFVVAADLIASASAAWQDPAADHVTIKTLLDTLNNSDAVPFIHRDPCPVVFP